MQINAIILCAGKGTRMRSDLPKVVHKVCEYEMVNLVLKSLNEAGITNNHLVLGYKKQEVINRVDKKYPYTSSIQEQQLGTGDAIKSCAVHFKDMDGITIVTYGDTPLVQPHTYEKLVKNHKQSKRDLTVLTAELEEPTGYGRIIRDEVGVVTKIVEQKDCNDMQISINEINTGIYCFDTKKLFEHLNDIKNDNKQNEYYLTDLVDIFKSNDYNVGAYVTRNVDDIQGVNDLFALNEATMILQKRINKQHMINGVNIIDSRSTYIGPNVIIGEGTVIEPNNYIYGDSCIGKNNFIFASNYICDTKIGEYNKIGPMSRLRNNVVIKNECRIGNYVEIKNSTIGNETKAAHLSYIGDAIVGDNVNFGCGVITANYDGINKFKTEIGDNVFIGSNSILVAPTKIEKDVFIAAGTVVSKDIDTDKFVTDRNELRIKPRR